MATTTATVRRSSPSSGCPSKAGIDSRILFVTAYFKVHRDSDDRAKVFDQYLIGLNPNCVTPGQNQAILGLAGLIQAQAAGEEQSFYEGIPGLIGKAVDAATAIPDFLKMLTRAETWVRVGEFVIGLILILMGLKQFLDVLGVGFPKIPGVPGL